MITGAQVGAKPNAPSYTKVFAQSLIEEARKDDKIVAVTAAMPSGTGLDLFAKAFPERTFDVGIAEQHGVTFAAGLATRRLQAVRRPSTRPSCSAPTTRSCTTWPSSACPCASALDRAGLVGADGPTHAGAFDLAYLGCLPGFVLMAAADEAELKHMVATAVAIDDRPRPSAIRAAKAPASSCPPRAGRSRSARDASCARARRWRCSRSARGSANACKAADQLAALGLSATVADARFAKPLDTDLIRRLVQNHEVLITIEEGVGRRLRLVRAAIPGRRGPARPRPEGAARWCCPTSSSTTTSPRRCTRPAGLNAPHIVATVLSTLGRDARDFGVVERA